MKKNLFFLSVILIFFICIIQNSFASNVQKAYVGFAMLPLKISGVADIDMSDWQKYGLYVENSTLYPNEGRVRLPLTEGEASGLHPGFLIGYEQFIPDINCSAIGEFQYANAGDAYVMGFFAGVKYKLFEKDRFSLGILPKIGYLRASIDLGTVQMMNHSAYKNDNDSYVAPVITYEGTAYVGEDITSNIDGFGFQLALTPSMQINDNMNIECQIGYSFGIFSDMEIEAGELVLQKNSPALVKANGWNHQAGIDPEVEISSLFFMLNMNISF